MRLIKKAPLFLLLLTTGILFTILAVAGKNTIYQGQEYDPVKAPVLSILFTGINDEIYPWQLFEGRSRKKSSPVVVATETMEMTKSVEEMKQEEMKQEEQVWLEDTPMPGAAVVPTAAPTPEPTPYSIENERLAPLRRSTDEEYRNHISADIYGDAGVVRAASYEFSQVDERYFDDALFIGDSRTVGLRDYTDLSEHADFLCETSLTIYKVMDHEFQGKGTVEEVLAAGDYGKIYLMVGINELGVGTTEAFMEKYTEVVDRIHELEPEALIIIQGNMRVSGKKAASDKIFNNNNINARNNAVATLADNIQIFYIDVNEVICDEEGNLNADYTYDQIHLLGMYNELWKEFLLAHGIV